MAYPYVDRLNVVARYRERKQGRNLMLFGKDTDADANARSNARQMFDGDLLVHGDLLVSLRRKKLWADMLQECALDYTFLALGIGTPTIDHPIVMTERLANPLFTRACTSGSCTELILSDF